MQTQIDTTAIIPKAPYRVRDLNAMGLGSRQAIYREIRSGHLRAAKLNARGDLRVLGSWLIEYLESLSQG